MSEKGGIVSQIAALRNFVGNDAWTESDLLDCLRQCGYDVQRAAERLMTGQYVRRSPQRGKSVFYEMAAASSKAGTVLSNNKKQSGAQNGKQRLTSKKSESASKSASAPTSRFKSPPPNRAPPAKSVHKTTSYTSSSAAFNTYDWLLCERWISDAVCTQSGRVEYQEPLVLEPSKTGPASIRFRGANVQGRLSTNLARMLTPLLRLSLISVQAQALMQDVTPTGGILPVAIRVYIADAPGFFELMEATTKTEPVTNYFKDNGKQAAATNKNKRMPALSDAAFGLLQWAHYGDVFVWETEEETTPVQEEIVQDEDAFEQDNDDATDGNYELDQTVSNNNYDWAALLPQATDPLGFQNSNTVLRDYQRQALYWLMQREQQGRSRQEMDEQLQLLGELALSESSAATQHGASINDMDRTNNNNNDIVCHIGSVLVSEKARQLSQTLDGQVNPICHPLWQQRFLASQGMDRTITFYVNELLKTATHRPPLPPTPCSGGILADAMGLGKTVMLLALIMKEKEERTATTNRTTTLIVAKLSLLPQWQDEIQSKTNLTCRVYYGPTAKSARSEDFANCDVVITTYGSIQCEEKRKNPALLNFQWLRVILDEAHCIKNQATLASKVCCRLDASHRWCVSGTIIQNSLDDVYGIMKFLRHEPWCTSSFWKAAITNPMNAGKDADAADNQTQRDCMNTALGRVRRLLSPIMIRRTKDSKTTNGDPILTLPPVETKIIKVDLTETEREFYNAVLARSLEIFGDFVDAGTAGRSYIQIFAMLTKLRQVCDHVALTVRRRIEDDNVPAEDSNEAAEETADFPKKPAAKVPDALGQDFYNNLLEKLIQSPPRKTKRDREEDECLSSASKRHKDHTYLTQVATSLSEAMKENCTHVDDECPICLEKPKLEAAALAACGHIFCKECLVGYLRDSAPKSEKKNELGKFGCPDGKCPCCSKRIDARRIVALSKTKDEDGVVTSNYLTDTKKPFIKQEVRETQEGNRNACARKILEDSLDGSVSSKLRAIMVELDAIWKLDPGSKVIIFSHYLGFLDMLEQQFKPSQIPFYRLDGTLTLKERSNVLDVFRTCSNSTKVGASDMDADPSSIQRGSVLLISMAAGGEGLNLVAASSCFIVEPWWTSAKEEQCVNRIHRIGQTADIVRVRKFIVNNSVEERILELQTRKKYVASEIYSDEGTRSGEMGSARLGLEDFKLIFQGRADQTD